MALPSMVFSAILAELRANRSEEARTRAAKEAHQFIAFHAREMSPEAFAKFLGSLTAALASLATSNAVGDRLACLTLIEELLQLDLGEAQTQFSTHIRALLASQDAPVLHAAARALGVLLSRCTSSTALGEEVEYETQRALEWLQVEKAEARRLGAVLILKVLAERAPALYYPHVAAFFDAVWIALRDAKLPIRLAAVEALRSTLLLVKTKETRMKATWYKQLHENAQRALKINASTESVHGALLVLVELAEHSGRHFDAALREFCDVMFRHKEHKDKVVRRATLALIPRLAALQPEVFAHDYLNTFINFVFANLEKGKARRASYLALGDLASAVGGNIKPYLDIIMQHFQTGLANKKLKKTHHLAIMTSFGRLAPAAGALLAPYVTEVLPPLFAAGLSPTLVEALTLISRHVPASVPYVRQRLLSVLSMLLAGEPFRHVENAVYPRRLDPFIVSSATPVDEEQIVFALKTLRTFDFSGVSLLDFLCKSVGSYLKNESATVRTEAVLACGEGGRVHAQRVNVSRVQKHRISGVEQLVSLILGVAVADSDPYVRLAAVSVLTAPYDLFLCQEEPVSSLCAALQDELFETRECVLLTLSRLAPLNPAVVLPVLRSVMLRLLAELDLTEDGRVREESARLMAHLMGCGSALIRPYVDCLVRVLLKRLPDNNARVSCNCLVALGQMAVVCGAELRHRIDSLLSVVISFVRDPTAGSKREVALQVLGQLAQACPTGPTPLQKYPELLDSILQDLLSNESPVPRREILRVLGILGALDPSRRLQARPQAVNTGKSASETKSLVLQEDELYAQVGATTAEEHAPCAAVAALVRVLRDASLGAVHPFAVQALVSIARSMEARLAPYLSYILPAWLSLIRSLDPTTSAVEVHLLQLAAFVHVLRLHLADSVADFCDLIKAYWNTQLLAALKLLESCAVAFQSLLHPFMSALTVLITNTLRNDSAPGRLQRVQRVLDVLVALSPLHEQYFHLIAPLLSSLVASDTEAVDVRRAAVRALGLLASRVNLAPHASRLLLAVARALPRQVELRVEGLAAIGAILETCPSECRRLLPVVTRCLADAQFKAEEVARTVAKLDSTQALGDVSYLAPDLHEEPPLDPPTRRSTGEATRRAAEASLRYSKDDWAAWFRRLAIDLLKDSSSPELASCLPVAQAHPPLSRELFNVAFFSVWLPLDQEGRIKLKVNLETALDSPHTPPDLMQALLSLAEFMEQHEQDVLIPQSKLSALAERCKAHAKALRYKEAEMRAGNYSSATIESLISINNQLGQRDSAVGILRFALQQGVQLKESSYEKLQRWEEALKVYEQRQAEDPLNVDFTLGRMRCLAALGEWEKLGALASNTWRTVQEKFRPLIAPLCAEAAWNLAKWEEMASYAQSVDAKRVEGSLYRAILAVRRLEWEEAQRCINKARDTLAGEVAVLLQESYERAYSMIVTVQQLSELEEIMQAKRSPDRRLPLRELWRQRLLGVETEPETWQRLLAVRSLLLSPQDDLDVWIKAASLCRKSGQVQLAVKTVNSLLAREKAAGLPPDPNLQFARLKLYWESHEGTRQDAIVRLHLFTNQLRKAPQKDNRLLAKCYLRLGQWQRAMSETLEELAIPEIVNSFRQATDVLPTSAKAWRAWGLVNFEVVSKYEAQASRADLLSIHLGPALDGFFRAVALAPQDSLQHLLRVLTLWFKHGHMMEVEAAILSGLSRVSLDNWLQVIPQLIARIHTPVPQVRKGVQDLLSTLGKIHPHALVWPLTVASKSNSRSRQLAAQGILAKMRQHSHQLVDQALLVSEELIRVAILWPEMWQEGLEEASRFYFGEHNVEGMFATLAPLYALLAKGPRTENETAFYQTYARELQEAEECCKRFVHNQNDEELNQAWDVYYNVFKKIGKQLPTVTSLELGHCSPALLTAADLQLAVPGTYEAGKEVVKIRRISPVLKVISSKQRPRKILIAGSDGCDYTFLLKGHEDLRQDERVMQLFGLVNTLLQADDTTAKAHLSIQRYSVIPLSPNSGLIGWVSSCDTLHTVLREYREARQIPLNLEHKWMQQIIADYDRLTLMQKLEVFRYALENTAGDDLHRILWLKSRNSEAWLARRTVYTRSLALMSMVGYILGLGDRHPSNLMLERTTGKVIHIDFGDCFEVAMQREKYPERIPFRLTRMLICAMEPSGVEGAFRATCEAVLRLLRQNKESLMAVLEAFVYDPLINWRLLSGSSLTSGTSTGALQTLPSLEFDPNDPHHGVGSVSSIWSTSASSNASLVSRTLGPISYSPSPARQTSLSLRTTNMPPNGRAAANAADAPPRRPQHKTLASEGESVSARPQEALNEKAVAVMNRISNKLTGRDFGPQPIDVPTQVQRLIDEATSAENLCQCYIGWCPFW